MGLREFFAKLAAERVAFTPSKKEDDLPRGFAGAKLARAALGERLTLRARRGTSPGFMQQRMHIPVRQATLADMPRRIRHVSRWLPHQGEKEIARRQAQMGIGAHEEAQYYAELNRGYAQDRI